MSIHINRYLDKISAAESRNLKDVILTIKEAKDLHADITKLLLALHTLQEYTVKSDDNTTKKVEISGGKW